MEYLTPTSKELGIERLVSLLVAVISSYDTLSCDYLLHVVK